MRRIGASTHATGIRELTVDHPPQPTLRTERLVLRPYTLADAARVAELAGVREVAATTARIPHPYEPWMAEEWIADHRMAWDDGTDAIYAITTDAEGLIGSIALHLKLDQRRAELGYWIGRPYWGRGFTTEAARALLALGFDTLKLQRISAHYMAGNGASGAVMRKLGMQHEGTLRRHAIKWGEPHDVECYAILKEEWEARRGG